MCGIAGYLTFDSDPGVQGVGVLSAMTDAIRHRGPDSDGQWCDSDAGVGLGMRRLAIIDLSVAGRQPMISECGRYIFVFNGEIYNYKSIRATLEEQGRVPKWRGHSDTEVLLAAISAWGFVQALQATNGMFAIALWDRRERSLSLACDRFGEKPVYYGWARRTFLFGSELKALRRHPSWTGGIDKGALNLFFRHSYIPAPHSVFCGIKKLEPGQIVTLTRRAAINDEPTTVQYWSSRTVVERARAAPLVIDEPQANDEFERLFLEAVNLRMESDVPLGAFLSGGFDSTAIVTAMQKQSSRPVRTFTIGFTERAYNEAPFAKQVAQHLGTDHTELYLSPSQAMDVIPNISDIYDEPFADSSQIPTYLVAQMARRDVTVALSGDAGDELFGGYSRYSISNRVIPIISCIPQGLRQAAARTIRMVGARGWDSIHEFLSSKGGRGRLGDRALKFAELLSSNSSIEGYRLMVSAWQRPFELVLGGGEPRTLLNEPEHLPKNLNFVEQMMFLDLMTYLPGDILTKVDRATMAVSLEGRMPFLDHRLVEFAWRLPLNLKVRGGEGKHIVREFVYRNLPRALMNRPKIGFGVPIEDWLRGPLKAWADGLLCPRVSDGSDGLDQRLISEAWAQHLSGQRNWQARLWPVLMYRSWLDGQKSGGMVQSPRQTFT